MIKLLRNVVAPTVLGLVIAGSAMIATARADVRDFDLVNLSGSASIVDAWFAPTDTTDPWTEISLSDNIGPNSMASVKVSGGSGTNVFTGSGCNYDIKVQLSTGEFRTFANVNLCSVLHVIVA